MRLTFAIAPAAVRCYNAPQHRPRAQLWRKRGVLDPISLALFALVLGAIVIANLGEGSRPWRVAAYTLTALLGLGSVVLGALYLALAQPGAAASLRPQLPGVNLGRIGAWLVAGGVTSWLLLLPPVRRFLARLIPIRPASPVNAVGLALLALLLGQSIGLGGLGPLGYLSLTGQLTLLQIVLSEVPLLLTGLLGVGLGTRRTAAQTWQRLGLGGLTLRELLLSLLGVIVLLAIQLLVNLIALQIAPQAVQELERASRQLYAQFASPAAALVVSLASGTAEEILFRGAIQPRLGLIPTAVAFGIIHSQYGIAFALISVGLVGLVLGIYRQRINTTAAIVIHVLYNLTIFLLSGA